MIAGEVEPPITRKDIMIRLHNGVVGMNKTCSRSSPTSPMLVLLIYFSKTDWLSFEIQRNRRGCNFERKNRSHERRLKENHENKGMDQPVRRRSESLPTSCLSTPLTRSLAHVDDDILLNLLKIEPTRLKGRHRPTT